MPQKKAPIPPAILLAQDEEIQRLITAFESQSPAGQAVAELEMLVRAAVFKSANQVVGWLLQRAAERIDAAYEPKPGEVYKGRETLGAQGIFGNFPATRAYYYHPGKGQGHYPADDALGFEVSYTPALAKLLCLEGADGTGLPMVPEELEGRRGKQAEGKAKTRQVYLGCVFTQHRVDEEGHRVRDWESTTYAVEHAGGVVAALIGKDHPDYKKRQHRWVKRLLKDQVEILIEETRQECAGKPNAPPVEDALGYFERNVKRRQYGTFRAKGYFIGSGVVEAGCKTVIGARCKQSGLFWSEAGAENRLAIRCINSSGRLDQFWKERLNQRAARNDALPLAA